MLFCDELREYRVPIPQGPEEYGSVYFTVVDRKKGIRYICDTSSGVPERLVLHSWTNDRDWVEFLFSSSAEEKKHGVENKHDAAK